MSGVACQNCGECCGPIPATTDEWRLILRAVKHMTGAERERLKAQKRLRLACPLRDIENKRCAVYEARPLICRMQGTHEGLPCPHNPAAATISREEGQKLLSFEHGEVPVVMGVMGISLGWDELLAGLPDRKAV